MDLDSKKHPFKGKAAVLLLFFAGVHIFYLKTVDAGFVTDFTGMQERLDGASFWGFLDCFGYPALHQVTNFFLYWFHLLFETNGWPWYLVFTSLHIGNGFLAYCLTKKMFEKSALPSLTHRLPGKLSRLDISVPALLVGGLFLLSPYNAETVVWKVCFNFLLSTFLLLASLLYLIKYIEENKTRHLLIGHILFVLALFTFELALALPLMSLVIFFWWQNSTYKKGIRIIVPQLFFTALYFAINKIWLGTWVGHYGASVHLNFSLKPIAANCLKYFSKYTLFWRNWKHTLKETWMGICDQPLIAYGFLFLGVALLFSGIYFYKKINEKWRMAGIAWLLFFIALAPISNLFVAWVLHGENDRYGYLASIFFFMGLVALINCFHKYIRSVFYVIFFLFSILYLNKITTYWQKSAAVVDGLLADFRWENAPETYVLAFPENFKGIPMFKDFSRKDLALKHALKYGQKKNTKGRFYQVAQFNMHHPENGLTATVDSTGLIKMSFHEWGSWWWRHGIGTGAYEREQYDFKNIPKGCEIKIKNAADDAVFIFSDGDKWKEIYLLVNKD